jgi:hypothetical protein
MERYVGIIISNKIQKTFQYKGNGAKQRSLMLRQDKIIFCHNKEELHRSRRATSMEWTPRDM